MVVYLQRVIIVSLFVLAGCAQELISVPGSGPTARSTGVSDYEKAVSLFNDNRYMEALDGFQTFLRKTDNDESVDGALFKIGTIYRIIEQNDDALSVFSRLVREYPDSPLVPDAMVEVLTLEYGRGDYGSVIENGVAFTDSTDPNFRRSPLFLVIADAYRAQGEPYKAVQYAYRAWNTGDATEKERALEQFNEGLEQLNPEQLQALLVSVKNPVTQRTLLYTLGMAYVLEEDYDNAISVLQLFVNRYPDDPAFSEASEIIRSIEERSRFTPYTVGCVIPLSGTYGIYGQRALNGIEMALVRSSAVPDGISFNLLIQDSMSDEQGTIKAVETLDRQRVGAVLGPMIASEPAASTAQKRGIPIFVFTQRDGIVEIGPYVFRNFITPRMQARSLVSYAVKELGVNRFAILFPDEKYGRRYMNLFWDEVIEHEAVVTGVEAYDPAGMDFADPIKKLAGVFYQPPRALSKKSVVQLPYPQRYMTVNPELIGSLQIEDPVERLSGIPLSRQSIDALGRRARDVADQWNPVIDFDAVFIPDAPKKAGLVIPQLTYYDIRDVLLMGTNLWNSESLIKMSGAYMKDTLIVDGFFVENPSKKVKAFVDEFEKIYGRKPGIIEAVAYDNALMVFETMRAGATNSRRELKQALLRIEGFDGITGKTAFFSNGEADKSLQLLGIKKGKFVQIQQNADFN